MAADPVRLHHVDFAAIDVTPRTEWVFARIWDTDGASAEVEITAAGLTEGVVEQVDHAVGLLRGTPIAAEDDVPIMLDVDDEALGADLTNATAVSAVRTAVSVLQALKGGVSLAEALGGGPGIVPLYANINRGLFASGRTPAEFARAAARAVSEGFRSIKCAPFDEVAPGTPTAEAVRLAATGIARVAAIREAIGPEVALMVDCHSRFDVESAIAVAGELAGLGVAWFEEPLDPGKDPAGLAHIAERISMPLSGGEHGYGEGHFAGLISDAAHTIVMPDVKFCGGAAVAARAGRAAIAAGGGVSLHCPSGPLSLMTSGHASAAVPGSLPLEHAVYEAEWRSTLLVPREPIVDGGLHLSGGPGLGAELDWGMLQWSGRVWRLS